MDRIRKALDLARRDRARLLIDEENYSAAAKVEPRPSAATLIPVIAPFVAPVESAVRGDTPERSIEIQPQNAAPSPVISLANYIATTARSPAPKLKEERAPVPALAPASAAPDEIEPKPTVVLPPLSEAASPTAPAPQSAQPAPASSQPFSGVVAYTRTRVYTPSPGLLESKRIVNPARIDPASAAFRMLRTQVLQRMEDRGWRSLAMLSPNAEDGKTTTAINLAVSLAYDHRHTVLLVDCDLRRPSIAGMLGITPEFGLDDVLTGHAQVDQCLYHPEGFDRLVILPVRETLANSSEMLSASRARNVVSELHARYPERIVLFDLPPILGTDDALAFLPLVDCALMVVAERTTKRADLLRSMELVTRIPIVGTVLNRSSAVLRAYG